MRADKRRWAIAGAALGTVLTAIVAVALGLFAASLITDVVRFSAL